MSLFLCPPSSNNWEKMNEFDFRETLRFVRIHNTWLKLDKSWALNIKTYMCFCTNLGIKLLNTYQREESYKQNEHLETQKGQQILYNINAQNICLTNLLVIQSCYTQKSRVAKRVELEQWFKMPISHFGWLSARETASVCVITKCMQVGSCPITVLLLPIIGRQIIPIWTYWFWRAYQRANQQWRTLKTHLLRGVILRTTAKVKIGLNASCAKSANTQNCGQSETQQCVCLCDGSNKRQTIETNNSQEI
jgi:hypothetical protein